MTAAEEMVVLKTLEQAKDERDAVAKTLYSRLFGWIVRQINSNLSQSSQGRLVTLLPCHCMLSIRYFNLITETVGQPGSEQHKRHQGQHWSHQGQHWSHHGQYWSHPGQHWSHQEAALESPATVLFTLIVL